MCRNLQDSLWFAFAICFRGQHLVIGNLLNLRVSLSSIAQYPEYPAELFSNSRATCEYNDANLGTIKYLGRRFLALGSLCSFSQESFGLSCNYG